MADKEENEAEKVDTHNISQLRLLKPGSLSMCECLLANIIYSLSCIKVNMKIILRINAREYKHVTSCEPIEP